MITIASLPQDLPLKLGQHGDQYRGMLPAAVRAVERHPSWPDFRKRVLDGDRASKAQAASNRAFRGNPVAVLRSIQSAPSPADSTAADLAACGRDTTRRRADKQVRPWEVALSRV